MTAGSDNKFPKLIITEGTAPSSPSAGDQKLYIDSTSHQLSRKNSSGTVVNLETNQSSSTSFHGVRATATAATSITNNTLTAVPFAAADLYDTDSWHDTTTNNTRITPNIAGKYRIGGQVTWDTSSTTGTRLIGVRLNGSTYVGLDERPGNGATEQYHAIATEYVFNGSTDYAELIVRQTTGGSVSLSANATYGSQFWLSLAGV